MVAYWLIAVMAVGTGGAVLSGIALLVDHRFGRQAGRWYGVGISTLLILLAGGLAVSGFGIDSLWPLWLLLTAILVASLGYLDRFQKWIQLLSRPRTVWLALLTACLIGANGAAWYAVHSPNSCKLPDSRVRFSKLEPVDLYGVTDCGRLIGFYRYDSGEEAGEELEFRLNQSDYSVADEHRHYIIRLGSVNAFSNCHGYVFANSDFSIEGRDVDLILNDNCYCEVFEPRQNDVVVYRDEDGLVFHTGVVRFLVPGGPVLVESKWGPLGIYLHPMEHSPYGLNCHFYRSDRLTHTLDIQERYSPPSPDP